MLKPRNKRARRRLFAFATVLAGIGLILLEVLALRRSGPEVWFWFFIGGLAILFGVVELLSKPPQE